jgi:hypothetical protein
MARGWNRRLLKVELPVVDDLVDRTSSKDRAPIKTRAVTFNDDDLEMRNLAHCIMSAIY